VHGGTRAALAADGHVPAQRLHVAAHDIHAHAASGKIADGGSVEKPGSNISWKSSRSPSSRALVPVLFFCDFGDALTSNPAPSSITSMTMLGPDGRSHSHGSGRRLTLFLALSRRSIPWSMACESYVKVDL